MGNINSQENNEMIRVMASVPMMTSIKRPNEKNGTSLIKDTAQTMHYDFFGTWSICVPTDKSPISRCGQCHVYDPIKDCLVVAYGIDKNGNYLNDMWELNLKTFTWNKILDKILDPRMNCSSVLIGREMIIFGGKNQDGYFADLHAVNLDTGVITKFNSEDIKPREKALLFEDLQNNKLVIWSGFNNFILNDILLFDFNNGTWKKQFDVEISGRRAAEVAFNPVSGVHYIFGSTRDYSLAKFDCKTMKFDVLKCGGTSPPPELNNSMLAIVNDYLFVIGGEIDSEYTYLYAVNLKNLQWFPFYVKPDFETTSLRDGFVAKNGLFKLPRQHSGALAYSKEKRALVSVMGNLFTDPLSISIISIGDALSALQQREDMIDMFNYTKDCI